MSKNTSTRLTRPEREPGRPRALDAIAALVFRELESTLKAGQIGHPHPQIRDGPRLAAQTVTEMTKPP